jgi:hypothetical protein
LREHPLTAHDCLFPEVVIEGSDEDEGPLRAGMAVLVPCECGETPLDQIEFLHARDRELTAALLAQEPYRPLYHWAPSARRKQIIRHGLLPGRRPTTSSEIGAPCVCFADSPSWAWALSGGMRWTPAGEWDLWQTHLDRLTEPLVLATEDRPSGLYEVRTEHRVYKRDLWLVGSRTK